MAAEVRLADVVDEPLDADALVRLADHPRAGAVVTFVGTVRNHDGGRGVDNLHYEAHPSATGVMGRIAAGLAERDGLCVVVARHRVGDLGVGDAAVVLAVSAEHRAEAFAACSDLIDEIKKSLPVWKKQQYDDGSHEWTANP